MRHLRHPTHKIEKLVDLSYLARLAQVLRNDSTIEALSVLGGATGPGYYPVAYFTSQLFLDKQ